MNTDELRDEWEDEVVDWLRGMDGTVSWDQLDTLLTPLAAAVIPIVEAEVRRAKADAWDRAIRALSYPDGSPVEVLSNPNPYREEPTR